MASTAEKRDLYRQMAMKNNRMNEVKVRILREANRDQALMRGMPGYRVQQKVAQFTQRRAIAGPRREIVYSAYISSDVALDPASLEKPQALQEEKPQELPPLDRRGLLLQRLRHKSEDSRTSEGEKIVVQLIYRYLEDNPDRVDDYLYKLQFEEREARASRREESRQHHQHVFPQDLIALPAEKKAAIFPKSVLKQSSLHVRKSNVGGGPITRNGHWRTLDLNLEPVEECEVAWASFEKSMALDHTINLDQTLGGILYPSLEGTNLEFTPGFVASLMLNDFAAMRFIVQRFNAIYGPLELSPHVDKRCGSPLARHKSLTPIPLAARAKVSSWRQGARTVTPTGTPSRITVPVLTPQEIKLLSVPEEIASEQKKHEEGSLDALTDLSALSGLFSYIGTDSDSHGARTATSVVEPLCLVCRARHRPLARATNSDVDAEDVDPSQFTGVARESLNHWKAMRQYANLSESLNLEERLRARSNAQTKVAQNTKYLAQFAKQAFGHAKWWKDTRSEQHHGTGRRSPSRLECSSWSQPFETMSTEERNLRSCSVLWRRLSSFFSLIQIPINAVQQHMVEAIRLLLLELRCVPKGLLFMWLHSVGPSVFTVRDMMRVVMFVRLELRISLAALEQWCKLPEQRQRGWKFIIEEIE